MIVNKKDFTLLQFFPSELAHLPISGGKFLTDVVMHELMHVMGAGHLEDEGLKRLYPTAVQTNQGPGTSHLALEIDAFLYERNGQPTPGQYLLTPLDQLYLRDTFGAEGLHWDRVRMHPWDAKYDGGPASDSYYPFVPCGWRATDPEPHYPYDFTTGIQLSSCDSSAPYSASIIQAIRDVLPQFTSVTAKELRLAITAVSDDADPGNADGSGGPGGFGTCAGPTCQCWYLTDDRWHISVPPGGLFSFNASSGPPLNHVWIGDNVYDAYYQIIDALLYIDVYEVDAAGNETLVPGMAGVPLNARQPIGSCIEG